MLFGMNSGADTTIDLATRSIAARFHQGSDPDGRAVLFCVDGSTSSAEPRKAVEAAGFMTLTVQLFDTPFAEWNDRQALTELDELSAWLVTQDAAADSIGVVGLDGTAPLAWLVGCTSTRFAVVAALGAPPVYAALSESKPMQPVEMTLNLDRALLASFPPDAEHLALVREQLDAGSKDYEWLAADADVPAELVRFLDERL